MYAYLRRRYVHMCERQRDDGDDAVAFVRVRATPATDSGGERQREGGGSGAHAWPTRTLRLLVHTRVLDRVKPNRRSTTPLRYTFPTILLSLPWRINNVICRVPSRAEESKKQLARDYQSLQSNIFQSESVQLYIMILYYTLTYFLKNYIIVISFRYDNLLKI